MPGITPLSKIQMGRESTAGTAVAATSIWRGLGFLQNPTEVKFVEERVGLLAPANRTYIPMLKAALTMDPVEATFEQLPHILEAGVMTATPTTDTGTGTGLIYTYNFPTTAQNTLKTYTLEWADNIQEEEMEYSFVEAFALEGNAGEAWMMSADWIGRQVTPSTVTGALSLVAVDEILFAKTKLYIDAGGGTIGTTQKTGTLLKASLNVKTGWQIIPVGDGNLYFASIKNTGPEITLDVTFEHDSTSVAEKAAWLAETTRLIRLQSEGPALSAAGAYTYKTMRIDLAGKWETFEMGEQDKDNIATGKFRAQYSSADSLYGKIVVVNELASLP